uniref:ASR-like protein 2 n=1 Tax=Hevea brasiliensis TaxID=3981 RepID=Q6XNP5_HEVBR|nr:ASR-like protein 2 [Hevea brasiliensis]
MSDEEKYPDRPHHHKEEGKPVEIAVYTKVSEFFDEEKYPELGATGAYASYEKHEVKKDSEHAYL